MNAPFKIGEITLESERLLLRPFLYSDLEDFFEYASVAGVGEMAGWPHHQSRDESREILNRFIMEDDVFAVSLKESGKVIGSLGVKRYGMDDSLTEFDGYLGREIGYVLAKDYWGRGIMPEAVRTVIDFLFGELNFDFLLCGYYDFNRQSMRVQEKCGFHPYRRIIMDTLMGTKEPGTLNLLVNPTKSVHFVFSHPETLVWKKT